MPRRKAASSRAVSRSEVSPSAPSSLDVERRGHRAFADNLTRVYVDQAGLIDRLDRFVAADGDRALIVTGESGSGKSSLLANWAARRRQAEPAAFLIEHYIGAASVGAGHVELIRRIMGEIKQRYGLDEDLPVSSESIEEDFPLWLAKVHGECLTLVIDALDQLPHTSHSCDWIPPYVPSDIIVVASTRSLEIERSLVERGWSSLEIPPLERDSRVEILRRQCALTRTTLSPAFVDQVVDNSNTANPLFLRVSLEEAARVVSIPVGNDHVDVYLASENLEELFARIIERNAQQHGELIRELLALIHASRTGLSRNELSEIVGAEPGAIERLVLSLGVHLYDRDGYLQFCHDRFRTAVDACCIEVSERTKRRALHGRLGRYFAQCPDRERKAVEWPWQLLHAHDEEALCSALVDFDLVSDLIDRGMEHDLLQFWNALSGTHDMAEEYERLTSGARADDVRLGDVLAKVGRFLLLANRFGPAEAILRRALNTALEHHDGSLGVEVARAHLAELLAVLGRHGEARILLTEARVVDGDEGSEVRWRRLRTLAECCYTEGRFDEARTLLEAAYSDVHRRAPNGQSAIGLLSDLGAVEWAAGQIAEASRFLGEAYRISRATLGPKHPQTIEVLNNMGAVAVARKDWSRAKELFAKAVKANSETFGRRNDRVASNLLNYGYACRHAGEIGEAISACEEAVNLRKSLFGESHTSVADALINLSTLRGLHEDYDEARDRARDARDTFLNAAGAEAASTRQAQVQLAYYTVLAGDLSLGLRLYDEHLAPYVAIAGESDPHVQQATEHYREFRARAGADVTTE